MTYEMLTVGKLKELLTEYSKEFYGDDTPVYTGDFEGNYTHAKHEVMTDNKLRAIFIGYEMHEDIGDLD